MRKRYSNVILLAGWLLLTVLSCSKKPVPVFRAVDTENKKMIVLTGERTLPVNFYEADFVILGGGLGGIAAALSICSSGRTALLVEETDRIAGCFSYQDTSLFSENRFVETSGTSDTYQTFRAKIREWYKNNTQTPPQLYSTLYSNMGDFGSDNFCFETEAALDVINEMLETIIERGKLTVIKRHKIVKVVTFSNRIASFLAVDLDNMIINQFSSWMFIDATRTGYLLPLTGIEYVDSRESKSDTGEPHAPEFPDTSVTDNFLYCPVIPPSGSNTEYQECYVSELQPNVPEGAGEVLKIPLNERPHRIKSLERIVEQDISAEFQSGPRARFFRDSVGIGYNPINISTVEGNSEPLIIETLPFQIPLGALIPVQFTNFLAGGRTFGATHIAASAYFAPSIEWAVGEAAGEAAAYCAGYKINTHELVGSPEHIRGLQDWLVIKRKVPIYWYDDVRPGEPDFSEAQLKPFDESGYHISSKTLHYRQ